MSVAASCPEATPHGPRRATWSDIVWLALVFAVGLLVRLPFLTMPMIADEGGYAYATRGWLNRTGELYDDLWISRPQGIFYLYAVIFETLGTDTVALRLAAWLSACGTAVAVWLIARHWRQHPVPAVAAMLFIIISANPRLEGYTANAEIFMILPSAWSIWTLIRALETRWAAHWTFLTGVLVGVATMLKPSGIVMLPVAIIAIVVLSRTEGNHCWRGPVGWLMVGLAMIGIPALVHGWLLGWSDFLYATVMYRLTMQSSANISLTEHLSTLLGIIRANLPLLLMLAFVAALTHRDALLSLIHHIRSGQRVSLQHTTASLRRWARQQGTPPAERHLAPPIDRIGMLLRLWTLGSLAGISMGGDWWSHYFIQIVAPFAIWLGATLVRAMRALGRWPARALAVASLVMLFWPWWVVALGSTEAMSDQLFSHPGYPAQDEVAAWIEANSDPGTPIFVAFDQAAIYYLADRPPAYRHLYDQELRALPESYGEIMSIIRSPDRPLYIVSTRQPGPYPDASRTFWQEVGQYYELETMIDGIPIYKAREYTPPAP